MAFRQRRNHNSEKLKKASEIKKKREQEDVIMQKEIQLKRLRQEEARKRCVEERKAKEKEEKDIFDKEMKRWEEMKQVRDGTLGKEKMKSEAFETNKQNNIEPKTLVSHRKTTTTSKKSPTVMVPKSPTSPVMNCPPRPPSPAVASLTSPHSATGIEEENPPPVPPSPASTSLHSPHSVIIDEAPLLPSCSTKSTCETPPPCIVPTSYPSTMDVMKSPPSPTIPPPPTEISEDSAPPVPPSPAMDSLSPSTTREVSSIVPPSCIGFLHLPTIEDSDESAPPVPPSPSNISLPSPPPPPPLTECDPPDPGHIVQEWSASHRDSQTPPLPPAPVMFLTLAEPNQQEEPNIKPSSALEICEDKPKTKSDTIWPHSASLNKMSIASTLNSTSIVSSEQQQLSTQQNIQECNYAGNPDITNEIQINHGSPKSNNSSESVTHTQMKNGVSNNNNKQSKIDINGNLFNNELNAKYSSSMRWKDVKTGLVRDRSNTYLKPAATDFQSTYCSPKLSRREKNSTSWLKYSKSSDMEEKEMANCDIEKLKIVSTTSRLNNENITLVQYGDNVTSQFKTSAVEELGNAEETKEKEGSLDSPATGPLIQKSGFDQNLTNKEVSMDSSHLLKPEADKDKDQYFPDKHESGIDQGEANNLISSKDQAHTRSFKHCTDKNLDHVISKNKPEQDETQSEAGQNQIPAYPVIVEQKQVPQLIQDHNLLPILDGAQKQDHNPQPVLEVARSQNSIFPLILEAAKTQNHNSPLIMETVKPQDHFSQPKLEVAQRQDSISQPIRVAVQKQDAENLAPWRRQETRSNTKSPTLNLITVSGKTLKYLLL